MKPQDLSIPSRAALCALAVALGAGMAAPAIAATEDGPSWAPSSSERLMKLPGSYLKKAVDRDFSKSSLAQALQEAETAIRLKQQTLEDLQQAMERADGQVRIDLRHRFLEEKRAYLELVTNGQKLRRQRARTKIRLYERLLRKLGFKRDAMTPQKVALIEKQQAALRRLNKSALRVDTKLFKSSMAKESRYAAAYAANLAAMERLNAAIKAHPMNDEARADMAGLSKEDHLRGLVAAAEAELATLDQESGIIGLMAKLVSLDALALSEDVAGGGPEGDGDGEPEQGLTKAVDLFITR